MPTGQQYESYAALLAQARGDDLCTVTERSRTVGGVVRRSRELPEPLVTAVLSGSGRWITELMDNDRALNRDAEVPAASLCRLLTASGHPEIARVAVMRAVEGVRGWTLSGTAAYTALFAAADPGDPRWTAPDGAVAGLLSVAPKYVHPALSAILKGTLASPFPELIRHALSGRVRRHEVPRRSLLRALLTLHTRGGTEFLTKTLDRPAVRESLGRELTRLARGAAAGEAGVAKLRAALAEAESPAGMVEALRAGLAFGSACDLWDLDGWPLVRQAHRQQPFSQGVIAGLVQEPDCPEEVRTELLMAHPDPLELLYRHVLLLPRRVLGALPAHRFAGTEFSYVLPRSVGATLTAADVLAHVPAVTLLSMARQTPWDEAAAAEWRAFRAELALLVAEHLGDSVPAWREARGLLSAADGSTRTVPELLAAAARLAGAAAEGDGAAWPKSAAAPGFAEPPNPKPDEEAFQTLLEAAPADVAWTLLDHVNDRVRFRLLVHGAWKPQWLDRALAEDRREELLLLSRRRDLPTGTVEELARLDDPAVNAGLLYAHRATWEQRHALLTGTPFAPGRTGRLPVDPAARDELIAKQRGSRKNKKYWLAPWAGCGDPGLAAHCLEHLQLRTRSMQLLLLLGLWERQGPGEAANTVQEWFPQKIRTFVDELTAEPDQQAALQRLRDAARDACSAGELARRLRAEASLHHDVEWLLAEGYPLDWEGLLAEHRRNPFPAQRVQELRRFADCPPELTVVEEQDRMTRTGERVLKRLADGAPAAEVLSRLTLPDPVHSRPWAGRALERGLLTGADLIRHGKPAREALAAGRADASGQKELAALVSEHLDGSPDAWVLALDMLDDFTGPLPELFRTAALATGTP